MLPSMNGLGASKEVTIHALELRLHQVKTIEQFRQKAHEFGTKRHILLF